MFVGDTEPDQSSSGFLKPVSPGHKPSLSGSAILPVRASPSADKPASVARPSRSIPLLSSPPPRIVRARTPDPDSELDCPNPDEFGAPLARVATAPPRHASPDIATQRTRSEREREREKARAAKLTKMGLFSNDASLGRAGTPYGHARNGGGSGSVGGANGGSVAGAAGGVRKFSGFKGFVQTLTGKSS